VWCEQGRSVILKIGLVYACLNYTTPFNTTVLFLVFLSEVSMSFFSILFIFSTLFHSLFFCYLSFLFSFYVSVSF
jgi:hypothetical protein